MEAHLLAAVQEGARDSHPTGNEETAKSSLAFHK